MQKTDKKLAMYLKKNDVILGYIGAYFGECKIVSHPVVDGDRVKFRISPVARNKTGNETLVTYAANALVDLGEEGLTGNDQVRAHNKQIAAAYSIRVKPDPKPRKSIDRADRPEPAPIQIPGWMFRNLAPSCDRRLGLPYADGLAEIGRLLGYSTRRSHCGEYLAERDRQMVIAYLDRHYPDWRRYTCKLHPLSAAERFLQKSQKNSSIEVLTIDASN